MSTVRGQYYTKARNQEARSLLQRDHAGYLRAQGLDGVAPMSAKSSQTEVSGKG